jgi:hypothetical protein
LDYPLRGRVRADNPLVGWRQRQFRVADSWDASVGRAEQSPRAPLRAATGFRTYCSAGAKSGRAVPGLPSGDPRRLLRVGASSYLMAPWPPAFTEIARFPAPARASGAGVLQRDLLAMLETKDGPQCDGDAFRPVGLPGDSEELRLWLHALQGGLPANPSTLTIPSCLRSTAVSSGGAVLFLQLKSPSRSVPFHSRHPLLVWLPGPPFSVAQERRCVPWSRC